MSSLFCCCSHRTTLAHSQAALRCNAFAIARKPDTAALKSMSSDLGSRCRHVTSEVGCLRSFLVGTRSSLHPKVLRIVRKRKGFHTTPSASWLTTSQIASNAFTWGTVAVLPFYSLMVVAPNAALTRRIMKSTAPYVPLGVLYACLLYLSWTPETMRLMFASEYWLPELEGIARLFSNEVTLASAWIHLLAVDLFAARQVFLDGLESKVETRHSVSLCLLFCPIGILTHVVTKLVSNSTDTSQT